MTERRGGKKPRIQDEPKRADYRSEAAYKDALIRHRRFRGAQRVWRQISPEEKAWILRELRYKDVNAALERDAASGGDLISLKLTRKGYYFIDKYPKSSHRRDIYRARLAASPPAKDIKVRKHERRLRERGL
jgi:hypothetical protein